MPFTLNKIILVLVLIAAFILSFLGTYLFGHHEGFAEAQAQYKSVMDTQKVEAKEVVQDQAKIQTQVVTQYRDRVQVVTKTVDRIIHDTPEELKDENKQCTIGPKFVGLFNSAANGSAISGSTDRTDATSQTAQDTTSKP